MDSEQGQTQTCGIGGGLGHLGSSVGSKAAASKRESLLDVLYTRRRVLRERVEETRSHLEVVEGLIRVLTE